MVNLDNNMSINCGSSKEKYFPKNYEIQLHKKRQGLKKSDLDVATYIEEFQKKKIEVKSVEK